MADLPVEKKRKKKGKKGKKPLGRMMKEQQMASHRMAWMWSMGSRVGIHIGMIIGYISFIYVSTCTLK